ncbi:MAG: hypothetical protein JNM25_04770 [Planctomycetes bacterium]|nr:hypothetical protein [Planctomycetota bacterium]
MNCHELIRQLRSIAAAWMAVCLLLGGAVSQSLQLADGKVLLAKVTDANGEGCRVTRLDNGGTLDLRWEHLSTASATAIKRQWDLMGDTQDEIRVRADEVDYLVNGGKQTLIGKIVDRDDPQVIVVQQKGIQYRIPRSELRAVRQVEVPVAQIYTKDEFYEMRKAELQPGDSADKHILLAEDLVKVRDYDHAAFHLEEARKLANSANPQHLEVMTQRLQRYKEAAKERELLDQIQASRSRGQLLDFEKGSKLIAEFEAKYPQTKLKTDFDQEKKRFAVARTRYLAQQVAEQWRRSIQIAADKKAADDGVTLMAAKTYAESKMTEDIVARVAQQLRLEPAEVQSLWSARADYPVGKRTDHFSYGIGSWVLGEDGILKGTKQGEAKAAQAPPTKDQGNSRDVERLARALREALERRRAAVQGQGGAEKEQTDEDWWRQASRTERTSWLRAYYAEFGGQLVVSYQSVSPCISCYGEGTTPEVDPEGKLVRNKCFLCQGTKWLRSFKAY